MSSVSPFHTDHPEYPQEHRNVYHDEDECQFAQAIKLEHRVEGAGGRPRCKRCEKLAS